MAPLLDYRDDEYKAVLARAGRGWVLEVSAWDSENRRMNVWWVISAVPHAVRPPTGEAFIATYDNQQDAVTHLVCWRLMNGYNENGTKAE